MQQPSGFGIFTVQDPPALPGPPFLEGWFFESPLTPAILLVVAGIIGFGTFRAKGQLGRARAALAAGVVLPAALFVLAAAVTTQREQLRRLASDLVGATAAADAQRVSGMLGDTCTLTEPMTRRELGREELLDAISSRIPGFEIAEHSVKAAQASVENDRFATVQIKVFVNSRAGGPNNSWWRLDYEKTAEGRWVVIRIRPLAISGVEAV
ncbi:MAG: hypothetical protein ACOYN0_10140 [Phycisphaerales bacterium]